jgi:hypothetical protein
MNAIAMYYGGNRQENNPDIEYEGYIFYIVHVVLETLFPSQSVAPVNLRPTG